MGGHKDKTLQGPSTPTPESIAVGPVIPRESQEKDGGDEGTKVTVDDGPEGSIQKFAKNDEGQVGRSSNTGVPKDNATMPEAVEDTQAESTNADVGESTYLV